MKSIYFQKKNLHPSSKPSKSRKNLLTPGGVFKELANNGKLRNNLLGELIENLFSSSF